MFFLEIDVIPRWGTLHVTKILVIVERFRFGKGKKMEVETVNIVEVVDDKKDKAIGGLIRVLSIFFAVSAPLFYMAGKVYYEGYLFYFHINPSMFPMDVYETFSTATMALIYASLEGLNGAQKILERHTQLLIVLFFFLVFGLLVFRFLVRRLTNRLNSWRPIIRWSPQVLFFVEEFFRCIAWVFIPLYMVVFCMFSVAFLLFLMLVPFNSVGKQQAEKDLRNEFRGAPVVSLSESTGEKLHYRLVSCSSSFCALYAKGLVITVPVSDIKRGVSDVRDKTNSHICWKAAGFEQRLANLSLFYLTPNGLTVKPVVTYLLSFAELSRLAGHCRKVDRLSVVQP